MITFKKLNFLLSAYNSTQFISSSKKEIAFSGRSNVGKSSILNMLCGNDVAKVGKTPGRTQAINFFENNSIMLADLPGYGYAKVSKELIRKWGNLIEEYLSKRENLSLIVWIMDARRKVDELDLQFMEWLIHYDKKFLIVINKVDKLPKNTKQQQIKKNILSRFPKVEYVLTSALSGEGKSELSRKISLFT